MKNAIAAGAFRVNGRRGRKGQRLATQDTVGFAGPANWLSESPEPEPELRAPIVYEDSHLLVVDKPAGMNTHGFSARDINTLASFLAAQRPGILGIGKNRWEPGLLHRLDRETSGLVLIAKTQPAFDHLRVQFRQRRVKKYYQALVWGITAAGGSIDFALAHDRRDKTRMRPAAPTSTFRKRQKSWSALTRYRRVSSCEKFSLLEIEMTTGVTHQIRTHLAAIGHPIVGDTIYGVHTADAFGLKRHFLHAFRLELHHPEDERRMVLESALPAELRQIVNSLQMNS